MVDMKVKHEISNFMQDVQLATQSEKNVFDEDYIQDVNNRIGEIEKDLVALKHELTKHNLNDW